MSEKKIKKSKITIKFPVYLNKEFLETGLEAMDLSERSIHCLKRAGMNTIGDVVERIDKQEDLLRLRNLGEKSANEIMHKLFLYHYDHLPKGKKDAYEKRVERMNNKHFSECYLACQME